MVKFSDLRIIYAYTGDDIKDDTIIYQASVDITKTTGKWWWKREITTSVFIHKSAGEDDWCNYEGITLNQYELDKLARKWISSKIDYQS